MTETKTTVVVKTVFCKAGDQVRLKSPGPIMTVEQTWPDGSIDCIWYDYDRKEFQRYKFTEVVLEPYKEEMKSIQNTRLL